MRRVGKGFSQGVGWSVTKTSLKPDILLARASIDLDFIRAIVFPDDARPLTVEGTF